MALTVCAICREKKTLYNRLYCYACLDKLGKEDRTLSEFSDKEDK